MALLLTDKCWVDASVLDELSGELVNHPRVGEWRRAFDLHLLANALEELVRLIGVKFVIWGKLLSGSALKLGAGKSLAEITEARYKGSNLTSSRLSAMGLPSSHQALLRAGP